MFVENTLVVYRTTIKRMLDETPLFLIYERATASDKRKISAKKLDENIFTC